MVCGAPETVGSSPKREYLLIVGINPVTAEISAMVIADTIALWTNPSFIE